LKHIRMKAMPEDAREFWYLCRDGKTYGPWIYGDLMSHAVSGDLRPNDQFFKLGSGNEWQPAHSMKYMDDLARDKPPDIQGSLTLDVGWFVRVTGYDHKERVRRWVYFEECKVRRNELNPNVIPENNQSYGYSRDCRVTVGEELDDIPPWPSAHLGSMDVTHSYLNFGALVPRLLFQHCWDAAEKTDGGVSSLVLQLAGDEGGTFVTSITFYESCPPTRKTTRSSVPRAG
jgi:hypothetical protein